jgi:SAM-dependent methyltransferase
MSEWPVAPPFDPPPPDDRMAEWLGNYPPAVFNERLYQSIELMERYTVDLSVEILTQLQVFEQLNRWRSPIELCELLSFKSQFRFALGWLLQRLIETGCVETQVGGGVPAKPGTAANYEYRLRELPWHPDLASLRDIGLEIDSANAPTLHLLDRAMSLYPAVARGEQRGEQALFGTQGIPLWLSYFSNENPTYAVNNWIGAIAACEQMRAKKKLRVLEVGAGAGSGSDILLQCLQKDGLLEKLDCYTITEPNAFFLRRGQRDLSRKYAGLPLLWRSLDINQPWSDQGISNGEFDLIYGVNVLHVAKNLLSTMKQGRETLAEDGWLIIGECVRPYSNQPIYVELVFQLLDSFTDVMIESEIRPNPGFLTADQWQLSFDHAGFTRTEVIPNIQRIREIYPHFFTAAVCGRR